VINEVLYDPVGTDTGKEWIELYNSGDSDVNLQGLRYCAGEPSIQAYSPFPIFILRAGRYLCLAEAQIPMPSSGRIWGYRMVEMQQTESAMYLQMDHIRTPCSMTNQHHNMLPDDSGLPGTSFAADVPSGYSLARRANGLDTNNSAEDFIPEPNPTPACQTESIAITGSGRQN
jgi:hypothetical protein